MSEPVQSENADRTRETGARTIRPVRAWRATSSIAKDPAGSASIVALLFGIILIVIPVPDTWSVGVSSVGYALVGGASFSFIYQFWANDALRKMITETLSNSQRRMIREMERQVNSVISGTTSAFNQHIQDLVAMHRRHWPLDSFPEGNEPNPGFNQKLEDDLSHARQYDFRGQSGKHLASRLYQGSYSRLRALRIIIEDATIPEVMNARIDEKRFGEPELYESQSDHQIRLIIENDMLDSLIGFHSVRSRFERLDLAYASRPTDVRVEIIDDIVYISPFVRNRPRGNKYPEVFRYDARSVPAEVASLEFNREFGLLSNAVISLTNMTKESLWQHTVAKGWDISRQQFDERYRRAERSLRSLGSALESSQDG